MLLIRFSESSCQPAPQVASTVIHAGSLSKRADEYADTRPPLIVLPEVHWKWGGRAESSLLLSFLWFMLWWKSSSLQLLIHKALPALAVVRCECTCAASCACTGGLELLGRTRTFGMHWPAPSGNRTQSWARILENLLQFSVSFWMHWFEIHVFEVYEDRCINNFENVGFTFFVSPIPNCSSAMAWPHAHAARHLLSKRVHGYPGIICGSKSMEEAHK